MPDTVICQPDLPTTGTAAHQVPGPLLWRAWADAVVLYWESCLAHGSLDAGAPVHVLILHDAAGTLAWAMPAMLAERLQDSPCVRLRPICVHAIPDGVNPLVCIGWRALEALPSDHYAVHRGGCFVPEDDAGAMQWQACAAPPGRAGTLITHYAARCGSASLTLPMAACALVDEIAARSGRYLLIGADDGVAAEAHLRAGGCGAGALNLHALLLHCAWRGAVTWYCQPEEHDCAVWLVAGGCEQMAPFDALAATLTQGHPQYSLAMREAAACLPPGHALLRVPALLQLAGYDPSLLQACMPALLANAGIGASVAAQWRAVLPATWQNYRMPDVGDDFYRDVCALAAAVGDWGLAQEILRAAGDAYGDTPHQLQWLAYCASASGATHEACALLARAVALAPQDPSGHALFAAARQRMTDAAAMHGHVAALAQDGELVLEPLRADHAPALLHQYRDPGIAAMTDLAELHTVAQVRQWIRAQRLSGGLCAYAVVHERWGFVGAVFLRCSGPAGYFYFWTGCDFQGRGYGPQAARVLWALAARAGIRNVYTSVYAANLRSRRALERLGFGLLELRVQAPDDDMLFVHKALYQDRDDSAQARLAELQRLCREIDCPLRFEPASSLPHPPIQE